MNNFEPYRNPRQSQLEKWRDQITEMRSLNWPYSAISQWLLDEHEISISAEAIRQFCKVRGILKGLKTHTHHSTQHKKVTSATSLAQEKEEVFQFESKPIDVYKR